MSNIAAITLLLGFLVITPCHGFQSGFNAISGSFHARVTGVPDGDVIEVLRDGREHVKVRLYGVDAPERNQDFGLKAMQLTSSMVFGRDVEVTPVLIREASGAIPAIVRVGGETVNRRLVLFGLAWVKPDQCAVSECREWVKLQERAIAGEKGLWSQTMPIPPWEFRTIVPKAGKLPKPIDQTKIAKNRGQMQEVRQGPQALHQVCIRPQE